MKKNHQGLQPLFRGEAPQRCPCCGAAVELKSADGVYRENNNGTMLYICANYPQCDAYVRVKPGTAIPIGTMANGELRRLRYRAHQSFDKLFLSGLMTRNQAYQWLAYLIQAPMSQAHIGCLGEYYCQMVIRESQKLLENWRKSSCPRQMGTVAKGGVVYAVD